MKAFRIGSAKFAGTKQAAFGGQGSLYGDGRWHHRGRLVVYAASHQSLALLEIIVHLDRKNQIQPVVGWQLEIPEECIVEPGDLPQGWLTDVEVTRTYGDAWLAAKTSACLRVPSVIVPSELNVLINPTHPDFDLAWVIGGPVKVAIDQRLL